MFIEKQIQSANFNLSMDPTNKNNWILTSPPMSLYLILYYDPIGSCNTSLV
jgi:hypothetical protein